MINECRRWGLVPKVPELGEGRMYAFSSLESSGMRVLSPSIEPPEMADEGSTVCGCADGWVIEGEIGRGFLNQFELELMFWVSLCLIRPNCIGK